MRDINYDDIKKHIDDMINTLEYDSMRSPGKAKVNAETLVNLYNLKDRYDAKAVEAPTVEEAVVEAPAKKTTARKPAVAKG